MNAFLYRFGNALFLAFGLGSISGLVLYDTPFNSTFYWAARYLSVPIAGLVVGYTVFNRHELTSLARGRTKVYVTAGLLMPLLCLFAGGWVSLFNGWWGSAAPVRFEGKVQRKCETSGRSHGWQLEILDEASGAPMVFSVPRTTYEAYQPGDRYARTMRRGCLGIPYAPRFR